MILPENKAPPNLDQFPLYKFIHIRIHIGIHIRVHIRIFIWSFLIAYIWLFWLFFIRNRIYLIVLIFLIVLINNNTIIDVTEIKF